jgi:alkyl sulfatase BDS1-like metallo-beta-lactamase superfamily hydrolase
MFRKSSKMRLLSTAILLALAPLSAAHEPRQHTPLDVPYSAPANFSAHAKLFQEQITRVGDTPVWQLEFHGMNIVVIEGSDGLILIDTGMNKDIAAAALGKIRSEISQKPIKSIVYTHHHPDHVNGASVFVDPIDVAAGNIPIYAAANFLKELSDEGVATLPIVANRAAYMFGFSLSGKEAEDYHVGCCGALNKPGKNETGYLPPNQFVDLDGSRDVEIANVKLHLFHSGGEAALYARHKNARCEPLDPSASAHASFR